jgi:hypothetical protein
MTRQLRRPTATIAPLFAHAEIARLEQERAQLMAALVRMRQHRRHGAILRTEFRLQQISAEILRTAFGKDMS